jgi:hypothetical protein
LLTHELRNAKGYRSYLPLDCPDNLRQILPALQPITATWVSPGVSIAPHIVRLNLLGIALIAPFIRQRRPQAASPELPDVQSRQQRRFRLRRAGNAMFFVSNLLSSSQAGRHAAMPLSKQTDEVREPYANIEEPKPAQTILCHPKSLHFQPFSRQSHPLTTSHLAISVGGPEKAGVGGSSPSLATIFSNTYRHSSPGFGSNWFQFRLAENCLTAIPSGYCQQRGQAGCIHNASRRRRWPCGVSKLRLANRPRWTGDISSPSRWTARSPEPERPRQARRR